MRTCPFCGTENEPFFRFCLGCGADLDEALGDGDASAAAPAASPAPVDAAGPRASQQATRPQTPGPGEKPIGAPAPQASIKQTQPGSTAPLPPKVAGPRPAAPPEVRQKTLDPGSVAKVAASAAAQAVAQAQVDAADRRAGVLPPKEAKPTLPVASTGATATMPIASSPPAPAAVAEIQTKKTGGAPEVAPPVAKKAVPESRPTPAISLPLPRARLVVILEDGSDGAALDLVQESTVLGREGADLSFPHDDFLAPRHAELYFKGGTLHLKPLKTTNGVFLQVHQEVELESGDVFRIGQQLLVFESLALVTAEPPGVETKEQTLRLGSPIPEGAWGRLGQLIAPDTMGSVYLLGGTEVYLGRERGDITFPGDGFVSGLHAVVTHRANRFYLKDLGSSNGSYLRLTKPMPVRRGMLILAGQQLFRVEQ